MRGVFWYEDGNAALVMSPVAARAPCIRPGFLVHVGIFSGRSIQRPGRQSSLLSQEEIGPRNRWGELVVEERRAWTLISRGIAPSPWNKGGLGLGTR